MFAMDEEKFPPPKPAVAAAASRTVYDTPGSITMETKIVGMSSRRALTTVQFRPPNRETASVYGMRIAEPIAAGTAVSTNLPAGSTWYFGPMKRTSTDHIVQTEKPMCSAKIEKIRL